MPDQSSAATEHAILQEITRPLESLPEDPLAVVNAEFPVTLRGYDREAVDSYVRRTRQLVAELQATRSPEAAVRRALERVGEEITGILQRAHETAEQITAQSRSEAEDRLEQARQEAAHVAGSAERRVRDLDADTDRIWLERQRIVADAEDLAGQLLGLAKTAAERFPADAAPENEPAGLAYGVDEPVPAPSFTVDSDEDQDASDEEEPADDPAVGAADDVEQTVAYRPLAPPAPAPKPAFGPAPGGSAPEPLPAAPEAAPPAPEADEPTDERYPASEDPTTDGHPTSDDTTAVIPPASQAAANRRPLP